MAIGGSDLSLLFKLRAQNEASPAIKATQADIAKLKTAFGQDFGQMQNIANSALSSVTTNLTRLSGNIPIVGTAVNGLASSLGTMAGEGTAAAGSLAAIAGPAGIAVIAIGAVTAGVIALHKGLFALAENAAGFRGKLFDLSQQTGVSVETLNALEIAARRTGGSIESISQSLVIFQGHLDEAQDSSSKAGKKFAEFGISTSDTEQALRDALKALAAMPESFRQTNAAAELFGRRGGKQFLALLKETGGDIDTVVEKLGDFARVTTADAKAADEFLDKIGDLNTLLRGALGKEAIPAATEAVKDLTKVLKENQDAIKAVSSVAGILATVLGTGLKVQVAEVAGIVNAAYRPFVLFAETLERIARATGAIKPVDFGAATAGIGGISPPQVGVDAGFGAGITRRRGTGASRAPSVAVDPSIAFMAQLGEEVKKLTDSLAGLDTKTREYRVNQEILNGALANASSETQALALAQAHQLDSADKFAAQVQKITKFQQEQNEAIRFATEGAKGHIQITEEFIASLEKEGTKLSDSITFWLRFNAAILANVDARKKLAETIESLPPLIATGGEGEGLTEDAIGRAAGAAANAQLGAPPPALKEFLELTPQIIAGIDSMRDAFGALGSAVGHAVQAFVLFGSAGTSFRKFTAEVLASVAAQSATKAIFELAEGLAMLALTYFTGNPKYAASAGAHFASAAMYGAIAGASAAAGRGVASGAFTNAGGGAGGSGGSSGSVQPLQTIVQGRNQPQQPRITIRLVSDLGELKKVIVANVVEDYVDGGDTREVISRDGH